MFPELLVTQIAIANKDGKDFYINAQNAGAVGINIAELKQEFLNKNGRAILTNENIKVRFNKEGKHLDFSTFDNASVRVDFSLQYVSPNKGGDGFGVGN